jgi:peptidoglycan-N-acetylglucosamine deacetylase
VSTVFLTFDDGPSNQTERILDALAEHGAKATFFQVGQCVERRPELTRRAREEGHAVGNHSWSHLSFQAPEISAAILRTELAATSAAIAEASGERPSLFRPPFGRPWWAREHEPGVNRRGLVQALATEQGLSVVLWDNDQADYQNDGRTADNLASDVMRALNPREPVVLLHDGCQRTAEAVEILLNELGERGYSFAVLPPNYELIRTVASGVISRTLL